MCYFDTIRMICGHSYLEYKYPCHDKRDYEQCLRPPSARLTDHHFQNFACQACTEMLQSQPPGNQQQIWDSWVTGNQRRIQQHGEMVRRRREELEEEEARMKRMFPGGGSSKRGGGSGGGSGSGGGGSRRSGGEKPYTRY